SWAMVRSPLMAARATFALKAGEWFRRGRLLMVSPVHGDYRRCQAEIPLIVLCRFPGPALCIEIDRGFLAFKRMRETIEDQLALGLDGRSRSGLTNGKRLPAPGRR